MPAGDWKVGQGEKKVPLVSNGDGDGGSTSILAANISAVYDTGLGKIFNTETILHEKVRQSPWQLSCMEIIGYSVHHIILKQLVFKNNMLLLTPVGRQHLGTLGCFPTGCDICFEPAMIMSCCFLHSENTEV